MAELSEIKKLLREVVGANPNLPITGTVKSVENDTCTVELINGFTISDVKLKATVGGNNHIITTPKVGSSVKMLSLSEAGDNFTVIKIDELEKLEYKQDGLELVVDSTDGKVSVKNGEASLFGVFKDLSALLKQLKVSTPNGPSGTPLPPTIQAISKFETDLGKLLK